MTVWSSLLGGGNCIFQSMKLISSDFVKIYSQAMHSLSHHTFGCLTSHGFRLIKALFLMHIPNCIHVQKQPWAICRHVRCYSLLTDLLKNLNSVWTKTRHCTLQRFYLKWEVHVVFSFLPLLLYLGKAQNNLFHPIISPTGHSQAIWLSQDSDSLSQMI